MNTPNDCKVIYKIKKLWGPSRFARPKRFIWFRCLRFYNILITLMQVVHKKNNLYIKKFTLFTAMFYFKVKILSDIMQFKVILDEIWLLIKRDL
jgi:hypothetical protein